MIGSSTHPVVAASSLFFRRTTTTTLRGVLFSILAVTVVRVAPFTIPMTVLLCHFVLMFCGISCSV